MHLLFVISLRIWEDEILKGVRLLIKTTVNFLLIFLLGGTCNLIIECNSMA